MTGGWIKIHRGIADSAIWQLSPAGTRVALTCLLKANYKPGRFFEGAAHVDVPVGSFITSLERLAEHSGTSKQIVRDTLSKLAYLGFATHEATHRWTIVTVCNFERYQDSEFEENTTENAATTQSQHSGNTNRRKKEMKKHLRASLTDAQVGWFEQFWGCYWRRVSRADAERAFSNAVTSEAMFETVMAAVRAQTPEMLTREASKRPHAATWLNAKRWTDEVLQPSLTAVNRPHPLPKPSERVFRPALSREQMNAFADIVEGRTA